MCSKHPRLPDVGSTTVSRCPCTLGPCLTRPSLCGFPPRLRRRRAGLPPAASPWSALSAVRTQRVGRRQRPPWGGRSMLSPSSSADPGRQTLGRRPDPFATSGLSGDVPATRSVTFSLSQGVFLWRKTENNIKAEMPCNFINTPVPRRRIRKSPPHSSALFPVSTEIYFCRETNLQEARDPPVQRAAQSAPATGTARWDGSRAGSLLQGRACHGLCSPQSVLVTDCACVCVRRPALGGLFYRCKGIRCFRCAHVHNQCKSTVPLCPKSQIIFCPIL